LQNNHISPYSVYDKSAFKNTIFWEARMQISLQKNIELTQITEKDVPLSVMAMVETSKGAGFILDTLTQDGKPLNVYIILEERTLPGTIMQVKPVGMFNKTIFCVPSNTRKSFLALQNREQAIATIKKANDLFFKAKRN
jgi:hypothetical protein